MTYTMLLTDKEWELISYCFPAPAKWGRRRQHPYRLLVNAMLYVDKTACQWRNLPSDFPKWKTVHDYFRKWTKSGLIRDIHDHLRGHVRLLERRKQEPSAAILDSQSVKSAETGSDRGYDAAKKVKGIKRHILVDTLGLLLALLILPADVQDRDGARSLLEQQAGRFKRLKLIWADAGYAGALVLWVRQMFRFTLSIVQRAEGQKGFAVLPRRWVVERTFGWFGRYRRLARHYERKRDSAESMVYMAMIKLMLKRIA